MLPEILYLFNQLNTFILKCLKNKFGFLSICFLAFGLFSFIYFPEAIRKRIHNDWTGNDMLVQSFVNNKIVHPFQATKNLLPADHFSKRDLRITPYILANIFHLNSLRLFYLQVLLLPCFIWLSIKILIRTTGDFLLSFWATMAILFSYVGNSFNFDTLFYDSYAYLGLLLSLYFYKNPISILFLVASYFVDERSVVPSLVIPLIAGLTIHPLNNTSSNFSITFQKMIIKNKSFWLLFTSLLVYVMIRFFFYKNYHLNTPVGKDSGVTLGLGFIHGVKIPLAIFSSLKMNYLLILSACYYLIKKRYYFVAVWFIGIFVVTFLIGTAVEDVTRSLTYGFLLIFVAYLFLVQIKEKSTNFIYFITFVNILTPTYTLLLNLYEIEAFSWFFHFPKMY